MLQSLLGILGSQQARQVRIGRLWFDPANVEHVLHRYCKQLFILTGSEQFPYQFVGSSTAVKFGNRHLVLCCGHQIDSIEPDRVAIYVKAQNSTVTASSLLRPKVTTDNSDHRLDRRSCSRICRRKLQDAESEQGVLYGGT